MTVFGFHLNGNWDAGILILITLNKQDYFHSTITLTAGETEYLDEAFWYSEILPGVLLQTEIN